MEVHKCVRIGLVQFKGPKFFFGGKKISVSLTHLKSFYFSHSPVAEVEDGCSGIGRQHNSRASRPGLCEEERGEKKNRFLSLAYLLRR